MSEKKYSIVDVFDKKKGLETKEALQTGKFIQRSAHLILLNSKDEMLLQKRAADKVWYPNLYTYSVSGTVENESYETCIQREMQEEIGIQLPVQFLFVYPFFDTYDKTFHAVFLGKSDETIVPDKKEIAAIRWVSLEQLQQEFKEKPELYTPPFVAGMKIFFSFLNNNKPLS